DPDGPFSAAVKDQRSKAAKYQTELQLECANSARIAIDCTDPGITLRLGEFASERCPYEGRLNAGTYRLLASLEGYESYQVDIELVAGENNRVLIPGLKPVDTRTTGTLKVFCPEAVSSIELLSSDLSESLDCPVERELLPGRYSLRMADGSEEQFAIAIGETVAINLSRASAVDERIGLLLAIRVAPGMGLSSGPLFQDDNETPFGEELDGLQPTLLTTAIENELGYFITDWLAVLVQTRFEIANLAVLAMAVLRFVPYENEWFSLRLDLGGGGGRILPSVETADGDRPVVRLGPGFGTANLGVGFSLSRLLALVVMVENRVAFPDFGIHFDLGLGLEIRL
ncbi:MAG: hypothetical protein RBU37_22870, partial [Myxococcota bacterium]|nr:hypothetical protein [Myxococcota bacterium]